MNDEIGINAERQPIVFAKDGEVFANSRDVAAFFGKEHRHVLEAIDNLLKSLAAENSAASDRAFSLVPFTDESQPGRSFRSFAMTRDGFSLLAMGFTGAKALKWKLRYIEAFNAMEAELRTRPAIDPMTVLNDPAAMRGLLLTYSEKVLALEFHRSDGSEKITTQVRVTPKGLTRLAQEFPPQLELIA